MTNSRLTRRGVLGGQLLGATAIAAGLSAPAIAQARTRLTVAVLDRNPEYAAMITRLATRVDTASRGRMGLQLADPMTPADAFDAVGSGTVSAYLGREEMFMDRDPVFGLFTALPFGLGPREFEAWVHQGGGQQVWDNIAGAYGIKPMLVGDAGARFAGWSRTPITAAADFNGQVVNASGLGIVAAQALGAQAQSLPTSEVASRSAFSVSYGLVADRALGLPTALGRLQTPSLFQPHQAISLGMNKAAWDALDDAQKQLLGSCCLAESEYTMGLGLSQEMTAFDELASDGIAVDTLSDAAFTEIATLGASAIEAVMRQNSNAAYAYDAYLAFMADVSGWTAVGEAPFSVARAKALEL